MVQLYRARVHNVQGEGDVSTVSSQVFESRLWTHHSRDRDSQAIIAACRDSQRFDGACAVLQSKFRVMVDNDAADKGLEDGHVRDLDFLIRNHYLGSPDACSDFREVQSAESIVIKSQVEIHGTYCAADRACSSDAAFHGQDKGATLVSAWANLDGIMMTYSSVAFVILMSETFSIERLTRYWMMESIMLGAGLSGSVASILLVLEMCGCKMGRAKDLKR